MMDSLFQFGESSCNEKEKKNCIGVVKGQLNRILQKKKKQNLRRLCCFLKTDETKIKMLAHKAQHHL